METMHALSITILFVGCGLHAINANKPHETEVGQFIVIEDYKGQNDSEVSHKKPDQERIENEQCGSNESETQTSVELINNFFAGLENYFDEEQYGNVQQESVVETSEPVHEQQKTTQKSCVIKCEPSVIPVLIGISAAVGVGYAVYKYITAEGKGSENKKVKKVMMQKTKTK